MKVAAALVSLQTCNTCRRILDAISHGLVAATDIVPLETLLAPGGSEIVSGSEEYLRSFPILRQAPSPLQLSRPIIPSLGSDPLALEQKLGSHDSPWLKIDRFNCDVESCFRVELALFVSPN